MSEASASTGPIICKYCGKPIIGSYVWSHGVTFHIGCTNPIASQHSIIADLEKRMAAVTQERDELRKVVDFIRNNCRVVHYTGGGMYPVEHSMIAGNNEWASIERAAAEAAQKGQSDE